jgi:hypothetical protein
LDGGPRSRRGLGLLGGFLVESRRLSQGWVGSLPLLGVRIRLGRGSHGCRPGRGCHPVGGFDDTVAGLLPLGLLDLPLMKLNSKLGSVIFTTFGDNEQRCQVMGSGFSSLLGHECGRRAEDLQLLQGWAQDAALAD